jgi:hypothetical protein
MNDLLGCLLLVASTFAHAGSGGQPNPDSYISGHATESGAYVVTNAGSTGMNVQTYGDNSPLTVNIGSTNQDATTPNVSARNTYAPDLNMMAYGADSHNYINIGHAPEGMTVINGDLYEQVLIKHHDHVVYEGVGPVLMTCHQDVCMVKKLKK